VTGRASLVLIGAAVTITCFLAPKLLVGFTVSAIAAFWTSIVEEDLKRVLLEQSTVCICNGFVIHACRFQAPLEQ
jgi:hypothetical protein